MAHARQSLLTRATLAALLLTGAATARRFYPDDPIAKEPPPLPVGDLRPVPGVDPRTFINETILHKSKKETDVSLDVNTIDELPDSAWFTNRIGSHPMHNGELTAGPDGHQPPSVEQPWTIYEATQGTSPILRIEDRHGAKFALRFDPKPTIEISTGADVVSSKLFYALGYNVPDNYAVRFQRAQLRAGAGVRFIRDGRHVTLSEADVNHLLSLVPHYPDGSYRALASRLVEGRLLGPFEYSATRGDDPNDTIPHERLRVLRALYVLCEWVDHVDTRVLGNLDAIQTIDGVRAVRHYLTDFGSSLGAGGLRAKEAWEGHTYAVDLRWGLKEMLTLGAYSPKWEREHPPERREGWNYEGEDFDPSTWKPTFPNPAFDSRTMADCFWAAKLVHAFTDDQIRALVATGAYSDPKTAEAIANAMIIRRNKIVAYYFAQTIPLDRFEVRDGMLRYTDLGGNGKYVVRWSRFDNDTEASTPIPGANQTFEIPQLTGYLSADIDDGPHHVTVYLHDNRVVGMTR